MKKRASSFELHILLTCVSSRLVSVGDTLTNLHGRQSMRQQVLALASAWVLSVGQHEINCLIHSIRLTVELQCTAERGTRHCKAADVGAGEQTEYGPRGCDAIHITPDAYYSAHMSVLAVPPSESDMSMVSLWLR